MTKLTLEDLRKIEGKWQEIWREKRIYEPGVDPSKPKFFITVPYPYVSGPLHIGHGRTYTTGDIIARFRRLCGYNVLFPMAFHVTGMPILSVSDRISRGDPKAIAQYRSYISYYVDDAKRIDEILESFKDPFNVAVFFAENIQRDFESIGLSIDWRRKFHTAEPIYNKFVEWQYYRLRKVGLITRGEHFVRYCVLHNQSVGEDDIADGDVNPVRIQEFVAMKFRYNDGFILASTLRPETIYGATNMWVNPDATYMCIRNGNGEIWYLSKEAFEKLKYQRPDNYEVVGEYRGEEFIGKYCISPIGDRLIILPAFFVDPDRATGFVYSEPADAPYDFVALEDLKRNPELLRRYGLDPDVVREIEPKKIINMPGIEGYHAEVAVRNAGIKDQLDSRLERVTEEVYKDQFYDGVMRDDIEDVGGLPVRVARDKVREKLISEGKAIIFYETSRKAVCRGGGKIIVARIRDQWFIDYSQEWWKEKSKAWLNKMLIFPQKYKKQFEDTIDWLKLRPCARSRGLGTRLPFDKRWVIESLSDSTIYMAFYTIVHIIRKHNIDPESLTPEVFDYVFLGEGDVEEIARKSGIPMSVLEEMRNSFDYWYPNDLRHTATPHISNHLTFFIMHHVAIFTKKYWPRGISLNETVIREGIKMAKSKGNVIPLVDISRKYSADLFRLYVASSADLDGVVDWREKDVKNLKKTLLNFANLVFEASEIEDEDIGLLNIDKWLLSRFYRRIIDGKKLLENFRIRDFVVSLFYEVLNDISYHRRRTSREHNLKIVRKILRDWIIVLSPIIPHICEEIWSRINKDKKTWSINLASWPEPRNELIDDKIELLEDMVLGVIDLGKSLLRIIKIEPQKATIVVAAKWKYEVIKRARKHIAEGTRNMRVIMSDLMKDPLFRKHAKETTKILQGIISGKIQIPAINISQQDVSMALDQAKGYIGRELGVKTVEIIEEENVPSEVRDRASKAHPLKPIIIFSS